jgi:multiple antibiotic resistance protein
MPLFFHPFIHLLFIGIIALFPVVNPIGSAFMVLPYFAHLDPTEKRKTINKLFSYVPLLY